MGGWIFRAETRATVPPYSYPMAQFIDDSEGGAMRTALVQ